MIHIILKLDLCATVCDIKFQCNYIQIENEINVLKKNNFFAFELNGLAFLDYDRCYDHNAVKALATG